MDRTEVTVAGHIDPEQFSNYLVRSLMAAQGQQQRLSRIGIIQFLEITAAHIIDVILPGIKFNRIFFTGWQGGTVVCIIAIITARRFLVLTSFSQW